jgi:hypothetical protein
MSKNKNDTLLTLSPIQVVALAGAVKDAEHKANKALLTEGTNEKVDFTVRIVGHVQKTFGLPGGPYECPASVSFSTVPAFCRALRFLGIGPDRLERALESIDPETVEPDPKLAAVFESVAKSKAAAMPTVKGVSSGTPPKVTSSLSVELITK